MPRALPSRVLQIPTGWPSREAGSFVKQLDFLSARRHSDLNGITAAELAWQPQAGANTIGMLLAHIAISEVFWLLLANNAWTPAGLKAILGIGVDDDGIPRPTGARAPRNLAGRSLTWYRGLQQRARAFTTKTLRAMPPSGMQRVIEVKRANGTVVKVNSRWVLFHVIEHEAGHSGQILLLRHLYRERGARRR